MSRVLCLHPAGSSAYEHGTQFSALALRLRAKHGIELIFVDAPLLDATTTTGRRGGDHDKYNDNDEDGNVSTDEGIAHHRRRWYVKEEDRTAATTTTTTTPVPQQDYYSGLDASLLHLSQLYNKIGNIVGVLGIGQGADVAALLPLLTNENYSSGQNKNNDSIGWDEDDDNGGEEDMEEDEDDDATTTTYSGYNSLNNRTMFPGLEFVILVNGSDILCLGHSDNNKEDGDGFKIEVDNCNNATVSDTVAAVDIDITNNDNNSTSEGDNNFLKKNIDNNDIQDDDDDCDDDDDDGSYYVGKDGVQSLHVIFDDDEGIVTSSSSERLAKMYGPNATIHSIPSSSSSSSRSAGSATMKLTSSLLALLSNIIGRYVVSQKNIHSRIIPASSTNSSSATTNISRQITKLRKRLWHVEQLATIAIAEEIRCNPPKALMAVIGPAAILSPMTNDDKKEKVGDGVEDVIKHVIEKDNVDNMKTNVNSKVVVNFDEAQLLSSAAAAEKDSINTNSLVVDKVVGVECRVVTMMVARTALITAKK